MSPFAVARVSKGRRQTRRQPCRVHAAPGSVFNCNAAMLGEYRRGWPYGKLSGVAPPASRGSLRHPLLFFAARGRFREARGLVAAAESPEWREPRREREPKSDGGGRYTSPPPQRSWQSRRTETGHKHKAAGVAKSIRAPSRIRTNDAEMREMGRQRPRFGYRRIAALLRREARVGSECRVYRLWRREGLKVPKKDEKTRRLGDDQDACECGERSIRTMCGGGTSCSIARRRADAEVAVDRG